MLWVLKNEEKILERKQEKNESVLYEETSLNKGYQRFQKIGMYLGGEHAGTHCSAMEKQVTPKMLSSPESGRASPIP